MVILTVVGQMDVHLEIISYAPPPAPPHSMKEKEGKENMSRRERYSHADLGFLSV